MGTSWTHSGDEKLLVCFFNVHIQSVMRNYEFEALLHSAQTFLAEGPASPNINTNLKKANGGIRSELAAADDNAPLVLTIQKKWLSKWSRNCR
jgi:hypothetical protein